MHHLLTQVTLPPEIYNLGERVDRPPPYADLGRCAYPSLTRMPPVCQRESLRYFEPCRAAHIVGFDTQGVDLTDQIPVIARSRRTSISSTFAPQRPI
jgi:hypothetical protein